MTYSFIGIFCSEIPMSLISLYIARDTSSFSFCNMNIMHVQSFESLLVLATILVARYDKSCTTRKRISPMAEEQRIYIGSSGRGSVFTIHCFKRELVLLDAKGSYLTSSVTHFISGHCTGMPDYKTQIILLVYHEKFMYHRMTSSFIRLFFVAREGPRRDERIHCVRLFTALSILRVIKSSLQNITKEKLSSSKHSIFRECQNIFNFLLSAGENVSWFTATSRSRN